MNKILKTISYGVQVKVQDMCNLPIKPRWLLYEVTENCNSRCKHCNIWKVKKNRDDLNLKQIDKAFSNPFVRDIEYIIVTGGEPTFRDDILEVYKILHKHCPKAVLQLSSNGINADKVLKLTKTILKLGISFQVGLSLDGYGKDHDDMRGIPGNFKKIDFLIDEFKKLKKDYTYFDFCVGMTVSDLTAPFYPKLREYTQKKNVFLEYAYYNKAPFYSNENQEVKLSVEKIKAIVQDSNDCVRKEAWLKELDGKSIQFPCFALKNFLVLRSNGNIVPCLTYSNRSVGNVKDNTFKQILTSKKAQQERNSTVKNCVGCLNTWAYSWSAASRVTPFIKYYFRHPKLLLKELNKN